METERRLSLTPARLTWRGARRQHTRMSLTRPAWPARGATTEAAMSTIQTCSVGIWGGVCAGMIWLLTGSMYEVVDPDIDIAVKEYGV